jgi:hypothetical protein
MQADTVWRSRIRSGYRSSEEYRRLGKSYYVCGYLDPLSLDQSLAMARVLVQRGWSAGLERAERIVPPRPARRRFYSAI